MTKCVRGAVKRPFWRLIYKMYAGSGTKNVLEVDRPNVCGERSKERYVSQSTNYVKCAALC